MRHSLSMGIFLELAHPIYSSSLKFSFDLLFSLIVSVCRCFPLMSHNDCNCIVTFSLLPHDVFISRCSTFHLPGTHTRGLSRCDNQSRAQVCRQIWKYLSLNLHKRTRSRSKREGELHEERWREWEGDSRTAARFANKGEAQMEGNLLQMLIN